MTSVRSRWLKSARAPRTLKFAIVGAFFYAAPFLFLGFLYLAVGARYVAFPTREAEVNVYGAGIATIGLGILALGGTIAGIAFGLVRGIEARSVVAWILALCVLGLGMWFDLPNTLGHPWWVGLNAHAFVSPPDPSPSLFDRLALVAIAMSADVHLALIVGIAVLLISPSTLRWLFGLEARHDRRPWKLR